MLLVLSALVLFAAGLREESSTATASTATSHAHRHAPPATPAAPVINSFTAEPSTIEAGQSSTLRWSITGATDMSIDHGVGAVQSTGQRQVFPQDQHQLHADRAWSRWDGLALRYGGQ